jgi:hypothetical protein
MFPLKVDMVPELQGVALQEALSNIPQSLERHPVDKPAGRTVEMGLF